MKCHAGAGHGPAADRGKLGWLCNACHEATVALIKRLTKRERPLDDHPPSR